MKAPRFLTAASGPVLRKYSPRPVVALPRRKAMALVGLRRGERHSGRPPAPLFRGAGPSQPAAGISCGSTER
jgi:hypothetical protein